MFKSLTVSTWTHSFAWEEPTTFLKFPIKEAELHIVWRPLWVSLKKTKFMLKAKFGAHK